jgi:hypothetical protein
MWAQSRFGELLTDVSLYGESISFVVRSSWCPTDTCTGGEKGPAATKGVSGSQRSPIEVLTRGIKSRSADDYTYA